VLDYIQEEAPLEAARRELLAKIVEGRRVVETLSARQTMIGRQIEEAAEAIQKLEEQLKAVDTVMRMVGSNISLTPAPLPLRPAAPIAEVVSAAPAPREPAAPQPFKPMSYLKCVADGHDFTHSRSHPGFVTCRRCRARRRA
jgi:hypothetical protein